MAGYIVINERLLIHYHVVNDSVINHTLVRRAPVFRVTLSVKLPGADAKPNQPSKSPKHQFRLTS